jgi:hypothetical protein
MSPISEFLINEGGVSRELLVIFIGLPFIASVIGFARYYIGLKTFSLYSPIILTIAFYFIYVSYSSEDISKTIAGGLWGVIFTFIVISVSVITHNLLRKFRLQFFPKVSLGLSIITTVLGITLAIFDYFNLVKASDISLISLALIAIVSEQFLNTFIKKKFNISIKLSIETILLSLICYLILVLEPVKEILINRPELILINIPINIIIGRFQGLRLTEYIRFQDILNNEESPINEPTDNPQK